MRERRCLNHDWRFLKEDIGMEAAAKMIGAREGEKINLPIHGMQLTDRTEAMTIIEENAGM